MLFFLCFLVIIAPITLFIHELGHAIGAYFVKSEKIELSIGAGKKLLSLYVGKLSIHIHMLYMLGGYSVSERDPYYSKHEQVIISLLGPLLNGLVGIFSLLLFPTYSSRILLTFTLFNFWLCIINLIPYRIGSRQSDGYAIIRTLWEKQNKDESFYQ